jgi:hypothetical protein
MLPFLEQSDARGWGVIILNPNENAPGIGRDDQQVTHALTNMVAPTQNVVIIAHSRGGASTADAMRLLQSRALSPNVRAIALTDSVHHPQQTDRVFRSLSVNWVSFGAFECFCIADNFAGDLAAASQYSASISLRRLCSAQRGSHFSPAHQLRCHDPNFCAFRRMSCCCSPLCFCFKV